MTPFLLFLYFVATSAGLVVMGLAALLVAALFFALVGSRGVKTTATTPESVISTASPSLAVVGSNETV